MPFRRTDHADLPLTRPQGSWQDSQARLQELETLLATLYGASDETWTDLATMHTRVVQALNLLATLPPDIVEGIAKDEADWEELESHNPN